MADDEDLPRTSRVSTVLTSLDLRRNLRQLQNSENTTLRTISHSQKVLSAKYQTKLDNTITAWKRKAAAREKQLLKKQLEEAAKKEKQKQEAITDDAGEQGKTTNNNTLGRGGQTVTRRKKKCETTSTEVKQETRRAPEGSSDDSSDYDEYDDDDTDDDGDDKGVKQEIKKDEHVEDTKAKEGEACRIEERDFNAILQWVWTNGSERLKIRRRKAQARSEFDPMPGIEDRIIATDEASEYGTTPGRIGSSRRSSRSSKKRAPFVDARFAHRPQTVLTLENGVLSTEEFVNRIDNRGGTASRCSGRSDGRNARPATASAALVRRATPTARNDGKLDSAREAFMRRLYEEQPTLMPGEKEKRLASLLERSRTESQILQPRVDRFLSSIAPKVGGGMTDVRNEDYYSQRLVRGTWADAERKRQVLSQQRTSIDEMDRWMCIRINDQDVSRPLTAKPVNMRW